MIRRWETGIGLVGLLFAAFALFAWFPADIKGGITDTTPGGKTVPGDAFFPVMLTGFIGLMAAIQLVLGLLRPTPAPLEDYPRLTVANLRFLAGLAAILCTSLALMWWAGPLVLWLTDESRGYRQLLDTVPYKYAGFVSGGFVLGVSLITWAEGHFRVRSVLVTAALIAVLILVFDVALTNVQLPPNADY